MRWFTRTNLPSSRSGLVHPDRVEDVSGLHQEAVKPISLLMPMSEEHSVLRTSLIPSLLQTIAYNKNRQNHDIAIFELGRVFLTAEEALTQLPDERLYVAGARNRLRRV